ncbi:hypothetical protein F4803DRAFT_526260 [Xylaria telfairii]|nr:hypothetical protein F4803DRAFT_526260 [Xylaria telfairii]
MVLLRGTRNLRILDDIRWNQGLFEEGILQKATRPTKYDDLLYVLLVYCALYLRSGFLFLFHFLFLFIDYTISQFYRFFSFDFVTRVIRACVGLGIIFN